MAAFFIAGVCVVWIRAMCVIMAQLTDRSVSVQFLDIKIVHFAFYSGCSGLFWRLFWGLIFFIFLYLSIFIE